MSIERKASIIALCIKRGRELAESIGEQLVREYRVGRSQRELAQKYSPDWAISKSVAENSIGKALEFLLSEGERVQLVSQHFKERVTERNKNWPIEKIVERTRKLGQISYLAPIIETDLGLMDEQTYYTTLVSEQQEKGKRVNWKYVAERTNQFFGNNRTSATLSGHYYNKVMKRQVKEE